MEGFAMLLGLLFVMPALAADLGQKPQMGWNSWNTFKNNVSEQLIKDTANALVSTGLEKLGYNYVVIDGGWQAFERDENNRQQPNATKFPNGVKVVGDEIHDLGLKFGIYSDAGIYDCGFSPGSHGYEELDTQTYAAWGVDYLKYDNCGGFQANTLSVQERFLRMSYALKSSGRSILYSLCEWGHQFPWFWADQFSESYRMSGDIHRYAGVSVLTMIRKMRELSRFQKPGSWADMDMLEVGTHTMTEYQEQTHFAFWAALKSPLIIGADITNITDNSLSILKNKEIIAINQDELGIAVNFLPSLSQEGKYQVWAGPLSSGKSRYVILIQNYGDEAVNVSVSVSDLPELEKLAGQTKLRVRDIWDKKDLGRLGKTIELKNIEVDQVKVLVLTRS
ncbi:hypothetical protein AK830_g2750 [Neonectria ditissima]|uniref:Alpha-galactosidase n=1 Tax=Neonectria ditissima TaxID=78410 RepID=A0A0N8H870_9HYPO|nr:hypothetical protein AK830_g2750 [Neonectria ditissima]